MEKKKHWSHTDPKNKLLDWILSSFHKRVRRNFGRDVKKFKSEWLLITDDIKISLGIIVSANSLYNLWNTFFGWFRCNLKVGNILSRLPKKVAITTSQTLNKRFSIFPMQFIFCPNAEKRLFHSLKALWFYKFLHCLNPSAVRAV